MSRATFRISRRSWPVIGTELTHLVDWILASVCSSAQGTRPNRRLFYDLLFAGWQRLVGQPDLRCAPRPKTTLREPLLTFPADRVRSYSTAAFRFPSARIPNVDRSSTWPVTTSRFG